MDYRKANLPPVDRALCDYAAALTLAPGDITQADVAALTAHGLTDAQVLVAAQVIGYFNYINRVADGLSVDPEPWMTPPRDVWLAAKGRDYL